ncbi:hypothetical protein LX15_001810 [Streptoalloteichus tenebrarius]|uniref:Uncharacterized protein n=1 Tax=Streptoalloteichus tenebrarius (strain ATCC 17920 / DSM 40477 / JCM 4838 / CBS 697.72 / NBRC 16177 / NCIMB 11028 / NRRL B-12390 / A12253. 1 / ISP 5477) TaxID=1933 RepID=A0ABT1HRI4_STRSD|nr:hypothetical protein [Streptoalloteichus tenebrarius]MCP2258123.1 hypothetical protein [Streptoalloteichus tenebrarius]BFF01798.1 hypothetical protein GCM10020241_34730 [Streptoalloteichus tenebrarius]
MTTGSPWGALASERRFAVTADQDWAPEWATEVMLEWVRRLDVPLHVFQTNPSPALDRAAEEGLVTRGWHPNFFPGSTHGDDEPSVVRHMAEFLPGVRTVRTHGFRESYLALTELANAGIRFDSQFPSAFSGHLVPSVHASGIVRLPVYFEDDVWMRMFPDSGPELGITPLRATLAAPGLKILNVHPIHLALNSPSMAFYDSRRSGIYGEGADPAALAHDGFGVRDVVTAIIDAARADGEKWRSFEDLCDEAAAIVDSQDTLAVLPSA